MSTQAVATERHPTSNSIDGMLRDRDNNYRPQRQSWTSRTGASWAELVPGALAVPAVSVVMPMRNRGFAISAVLDALARSKGVDVEVIIVDDASDDDGAWQAATHPLRLTVVRMSRAYGSSAARNIGTAIASAETIVYLDADMVLPDGVLRELAARACPDLVLPGFRHHVAIDEYPQILTTKPDLESDPRVNQLVDAGRLPFSGAVLEQPTHCRLLDATDDRLQMGHGRWLLDWSLPRTVITALVAMPRTAVIDVGGFHPGFHGLWGAEDAYVAAKLIAAGLKVAPVRSAVGFHLDPPNVEQETGRKRATLARTIAFYRSLLGQPLPTDGAEWFRRHTRDLLGDALVVRTWSRSFQHNRQKEVTRP